MGSLKRMPCLKRVNSCRPKPVTENSKRDTLGKLQIPRIQASGRKDKKVKTILTLKVK
jgi:hypothetical protein